MKEKPTKSANRMLEAFESFNAASEEQQQKALQIFTEAIERQTNEQLKDFFIEIKNYLKALQREANTDEK